jgi:hypothetical protein
MAANETDTVQTESIDKSTEETVEKTHPADSLDSVEEAGPGAITKMRHGDSLDPDEAATVTPKTWIVVFVSGNCLQVYVMHPTDRFADPLDGIRVRFPRGRGSVLSCVTLTWYRLSFWPIPVMANIGTQVATEVHAPLKSIWFIPAWTLSITVCFMILYVLALEAGQVL